MTSSKLIGQLSTPSFGKGIQFVASDSSFYINAAFRFQILYNGEWARKTTRQSYRNISHGFLVRRSRIKLKGWILDPKLRYSVELALSNRDQGGGLDDEFDQSPNTVLDATIEYAFSKNFSLLFGQKKLPGNRERVISSGSLQLVDRSRLNSRYNLDRDVGLQLKGQQTLGKQFLVKEIFSFTQGEGRNVTQGNFDGFAYTFRGELLPLGAFTSGNDYQGGAAIREDRSKISIGITYEINKNAVRERGHLGSFLQTDDGIYLGRDMYSFFIDGFLKYQGFSIMGEYAKKSVTGTDPLVFDAENNLIGTYFTGTGFNVVAGYNFPQNLEVSLRYTQINPDEMVDVREREYTIGLSRYIVKHKFKFQTDLIYRQTKDIRDQIFFRFQTDVHF